MMKPDIRTETYLIVVKDGQYLSLIGTMAFGHMVWDSHLSNAWVTRNKQKALAVAEKYGGQIALFNKIIWEVKVL